MSINNWIGGTTAAANVQSLTVGGTWAAGNTVRTTMTAEDGSTTQAVTTSAASSTIETGVVDPHITDLNNSSQSLFSAVTWVKTGTTVVQGTADIAGVPFTMAGTVPAGSGTYGSLSTVVANAGPNDWNTAANFTEADETTAPVPGARDDVKILPHPTDEDNAGNPISYDVLYGLDQSAIDLNTLRIPKSYRGSIGDSVNGYFCAL